ncbi:MAG: dUTP diphosphatase [Synergistaceae bacterium]|jgi:dUTP pyrophosphatase|nr:dUTP diphosphatase [Synergistaceae bacterium]
MLNITNKKTVTVRFKRDAAASRAPLPSYATDGAAGMDLRASETIELEPGEFKSVGTGLFLEIPPGFEGQVRPRSGLAARHGVTLLNSPGTIDSDYRGELRVIVINHGSEIFKIEPGDRLAQIVFAALVRVELDETDGLSDTKRASGGFGSTGIK